MSNCIKSVYSRQEDILQAIFTLRGLDHFDADITYGNGAFYKSGEVPEPSFRSDIEPLFPEVIRASSSNLPIEDSTLGSVIFDPPFLTYIRDRRQGNKGMVMATRFGGYWDYRELQRHYMATIIECARVLQKKGTLVIKCQDIIHNHKMHCTHHNIINWGAGMFRLADMFILPAQSRMASPQAGKQRHARIYHSYFLVFEKL